MKYKRTSESPSATKFAVKILPAIFWFLKTKYRFQSKIRAILCQDILNASELFQRANINTVEDLIYYYKHLYSNDSFMYKIRL